MRHLDIYHIKHPLTMKNSVHRLIMVQPLQSAQRNTFSFDYKNDRTCYILRTVLKYYNSD
jgi:hypothetical protein